MANELDSNFAIAVDVLALINKGDVSSVVDGQVNSYADRGENWSKVCPVTGSLRHLFDTYTSAEYFHIFHDGEWTFLTRDEVAEMI